MSQILPECGGLGSAILGRERLLLTQLQVDHFGVTVQENNLNRTSTWSTWASSLPQFVKDSTQMRVLLKVSSHF